ncbi:hypothetical protein ABVK25_007577 [Lepraria finkii]|uniref:Uncharacterized protein n=1 Tax=Lepraria finkii TaxID=1340010 RepID=A0ABR4B324_9LECA
MMDSSIASTTIMIEKVVSYQFFLPDGNWGSNTGAESRQVASQMIALMKLLRQANVVDLISQLLFITITVYTTPEETIHYAKRRNKYEIQPNIAFAIPKDQKSVDGPLI